MAPSVVEMIGKKKRRRGKKEEASSSVAALGACEPKAEEEKGTEKRLTSARYMHSFLSHLNSN
jgi:hypothetical protein